MAHITVQTLSFAIFSMVFDRLRLIDRINSVTPEVEEEEHLADTLMEMDKALGELTDEYQQSRSEEGGGYDVDTIYANAQNEYTHYVAQHRAPTTE